MSDCMVCRHLYQGADLRHRCRQNGLLATPANAEGCKKFEREAGSDDVQAVWCGSAWRYDAESRN